MGKVMMQWGIGFFLLSGMLLPAVAAERESDEITLNPQALVPNACPASRANDMGLPVEFQVFQDLRQDKKVAELEKGDDVSPVYLSRPANAVIQEAITLLMERCGYRHSTGAEEKRIIVSGEVQDFVVNWQKKLVTAKGGGQLSVKLKLSTPLGGYYFFEFNVESDEKGIRKKGISQIDKQVQRMTKSLLTKLSEHRDFHAAIVKLAEGKDEGASTYPVEQYD